MRLLCLLLLLFSLSLDGYAQTVTLSARLDSVVRRLLPEGSQVGICAYDLESDRLLYTYQADQLSRPASNMKLLTAITALSHPQGEEPFRTEVWTDGILQNDTLLGNLYVVGGMDPEFSDSSLDSLVSQLVHLPLHRIEGILYGDVSLKDSLYWGAGWSWDDTPEAYQPYLSPLMLHKGVVELTVKPTGAGEPAAISCIPSSTYYTIHNQTRSHTPQAGRFRLTRNWLENGNQLLISGNVTKERTSSINLYSSADFFMHTLRQRLEATGLEFAHAGYAFRECVRDSSAKLLVCYETPIQPILSQLMKESDNLNAEALLYRLGWQDSEHRHVSAQEGLDAVRALIREMGLRPEQYKIADGCGLSNYNYVSPRLLVAFLRYAYAHPSLFARLYESLPVGGTDGTLEFRMKRGTRSYRNVRAKTGTITGISTLSGYLRRANGHLTAFSIMNQNVLSARETRALQDAVCDELIR